MSAQGWIGKTIGSRYKIEALLGQGGMSAVYRAYDPNLRRPVAIKLIHPHLSTDPNFIGRFKEEAAAVARLRHPNIVQVHDFSLDGDTYYMVMEYLVGETLLSRLKRFNATGRHMPYPEVARICLQICQAVGYAHNHELIHRDIKPANIMLDVNDQAILMDFGIVKIIGGEYHTVTGATIGTAMYMSPEQIRGERLDDRSDIYSLGVTLYEMLSGHPPFQADSAVTLMMMVLNDPLPDLRQVRDDIPVELIPVVTRSLAKDKAQRYQSTDEMIASLEPIIGKLADIAPSPTLAENESVTPLELEADLASQKDKDNFLLPDTLKGEINPETSIEDTQVEYPNKELQTLADQGVSVVEIPPESPEILPQGVLPAPNELKRFSLRRLGIPILGAVFVLALIAVVSYSYFSRKPPSMVLTPISSSSIAIDAGTATNLVSLGVWQTDSYVIDLAFSPDSRLIASVNNRDWAGLSKYQFYATVWEIEEGALSSYLLGNTRWVSGVDFSPDGQHLALASEDATISIWQTPGNVLERNIQSTFGALTAVDFSPNNLLIAASSMNGYVGLWQVENANLLRTMPKQDNEFNDVQFSPDGSLLASASADGSIYLWKVSDGSLAMTLTGNSAVVSGIAFSPEGDYLASASSDNNVRLWSLVDGTVLHLMQAHTDHVEDVAFSVDGSLLASGSSDGSICLWRINDGQLLKTLPGEDSILTLAFSPNGYNLASGGSQGSIQFYGISEALPLEVTTTPSSP